MDRRTFLKQLPIVAALPFLPNLPELPDAAQVLTERELGHIFKVLDEGEAIAYQVKASGLDSALSGVAQVAGEIDTSQVFNRIAEGVSNFANEGLDAVDMAKRLEIGLGKLLEINKLYG